MQVQIVNDEYGFYSMLKEDGTKVDIEPDTRFSEVLELLLEV